MARVEPAEGLGARWGVGRLRAAASIASAMALALLCCQVADSTPAGGASEERLSEIRRALKSRGEGLTDAEIRDLVQRSFAAMDRSGTRADFYRGMTLVADLCRLASPGPARSLRAEAMGRLVAEPVDSVRWSVLLSSRFLPPFKRLPRGTWAAELAAYDGLLDDLGRRAEEEGLRAELLAAKAQARVWLERRWPWLSEDQRRRAIEFLRTLAEIHGERSPAGRSGPGGTTFAEFAQARIVELERLAHGAPAPPTEAEDLEGEPLDLAAYRGRVVVLDFWTTFCAPCRAMVPGTRALLERFRAQPFTVLGVNGDSDREMGLATQGRLDMGWRSFWDGPEGVSGPLAQTWMIRSWPTLFVLGPEGRIRAKLTAELATDEELERVVSALLAEVAVPEDAVPEDAVPENPVPKDAHQ